MATIEVPDKPKRRVRIARKNSEASVVHHAAEAARQEGYDDAMKTMEEQTRLRIEQALNEERQRARAEYERIDALHREANIRVDDLNTRIRVLESENRRLAGELDRERTAWRSDRTATKARIPEPIYEDDDDDEEWIKQLPDEDWGESDAKALAELPGRPSDRRKAKKKVVQGRRRLRAKTSDSS